MHAADRSLSYAELERESAALAVRLRAAGVAPEQRVGVCLRRDSGLLVGLLGVLRAGGCYVPLDPAYPEERVAYMLDDADCLLVLVDASTRERVAALGRPCLTLEEGGDQANDLALPASEVGADHLAYIIYTSGSTGRPKGVAIEHGSAHAFLRWAGQHYAAEEWSGVLAATSVCFDLSVYELFGTLAEGGTLHLVENLFSLPDYPRRDEISLLNTVPSVCAALLALGDLPGGVRTLNLAGEPLRGHLVRQIRGQPQVRRLVNLYGPTEDTTYSTVHELDLHAEALDEPPIGRPLPGTTVEVLDGFEAPLPLGVAGELYLGGIGLARGYFGKPEQTAERFRVDPGSGERRYRTGDRVRMREDGVLEHLGRLDDQVKFNGFRIELGEIASCLASFPGVSEACAMLTEDSAGLRRLVGYLAAPFAPPLQALNEHLGQSLPHYMLPSAFVVLAELPKTLNGKIDRKALPRPQATGAEPQALPSDPLEQALHQAWQAQLGAPPRADRASTPPAAIPCGRCTCSRRCASDCPDAYRCRRSPVARRPRGPAGTAAPGRARGRRAGAERRRRRAEPRRTAPVGGPATGAGGHLLQPAGPPAHSRRHGRRHRTGLAPVAGTACGAAPACRNGRRRAAAACAGGACGAPATPAGERRRPRRAVAGGWRAP